MTFKTVWIIFAKELIDTLRERRTLIFMLLIPTLAVPAFVLGVTRFALHIQKKQAVNTVKIAADRASRENYARLVHTWFASTGAAFQPPEAVSHMLEPFVDAQTTGRIGPAPEEFFEDPTAFDDWMHVLTRRATAIIDVMDLPEEAPTGEVPAALRRQVLDLNRVAIRGRGLVDFVDPETLPPAPDHF